MSPVYDPDAPTRLAPPTEIERRAPWVIHLANATLRGHLTWDEWEREEASINAGLQAAAAELPVSAGA